MAKTETSIANLKINKGTYAKIQTNLASIGNNELVITTDKNVPIPTASDNGKFIGVENGDYALLTASGGNKEISGASAIGENFFKEVLTDSSYYVYKSDGTTEYTMAERQQIYQDLEDANYNYIDFSNGDPCVSSWYDNDIFCLTPLDYTYDEYVVYKRSDLVSGQKLNISTTGTYITTYDSGDYIWYLINSKVLPRVDNTCTGGTDATKSTSIINSGGINYAIPKIVGVKGSTIVLARTIGNTITATVNSSNFSRTDIYRGDTIIDYYGSMGQVTAKSGTSITIKTTHVSPEEFYCMAAGTLISMADGSEKPIEEVKAGDIVASYDYNTKQNTEAVVIDVGIRGASNLFDNLLFTDGSVLELKGGEEKLYKVEDDCCHAYTKFNTGDHVRLLDGTTKEVDKLISSVATEDGEYVQYYSLVTSNCAFYGNGVLFLQVSWAKLKLYNNILHLPIPEELADLFEQDKEWHKRERELSINKKSIKTQQAARKQYFTSVQESQRLRKDMTSKDYKGIKMIEKLMDTIINSDESTLVKNLLTFAAETKEKYEQYLQDRQIQRDSINANDETTRQTLAAITEADNEQVTKDGYSKNLVQAVRNNLSRMAAKDNAAFERYKAYYCRPIEEPQEEEFVDPIIAQHRVK